MSSIRHGRESTLPTSMFYRLERRSAYGHRRGRARHIEILADGSTGYRVYADLKWRYYRMWSLQVHAPEGYRMFTTQELLEQGYTLILPKWYRLPEGI